MIGKALSGCTGQGFFMIRPQGRDMADGRNAVTGVDVLFPPRRKFLEWAQRKQTASQSGKADQAQTYRHSNDHAFIHLAAPPFQQPQQAPGPYDQHRRSPCQGQKEQGLPCRRRGPQQQQIICGVGGHRKPLDDSPEPDVGGETGPTPLHCSPGAQVPHQVVRHQPQHTESLYKGQHGS